MYCVNCLLVNHFLNKFFFFVLILFLMSIYESRNLKQFLILIFFFLYQTTYLEFRSIFVMVWQIFIHWLTPIFGENISYISMSIMSAFNFDLIYGFIYLKTSLNNCYDKALNINIEVLYCLHHIMVYFKDISLR